MKFMVSRQMQARVENRTKWECCSSSSSCSNYALGENNRFEFYTAFILPTQPIPPISMLLLEKSWFVSCARNRKTFAKWKISHLLHRIVSVCAYFFCNVFFSSLVSVGCSDKFTVWNYLSAYPLPCFPVCTLGPVKCIPIKYICTIFPNFF